MSDDLLRQYRMGRLTEAERQAIEQRAFEEDAFEEKLLEAEADLLDDWARGMLSAEDASAVERAFSREQLALARAIRKVAAARRVVPLADPAAKRTETAWPRWAVAAALLVGLLPSLVLLQRSPRVERVEVPAAGGTIAELALHVPTTRGSEAPKLQVPAKAEWVRVSLDVEAGYEFYEVRVESAGSGLAFSQGIKSGPPLTVTIPTKALAAGAYDFVVSGRKGSETALLATYACVVER